MMKLSVDQFEEFFCALHDAERPSSAAARKRSNDTAPKTAAKRPFPWQKRLSRQIAEEGAWPDLLELPTSSGKTVVIDIALFSLALDVDRAVHERRAPRRIVFVVDRRAIVEQAFEHAQKIAEKLESARDGVLGAVAEKLRQLSGSGPSEAPLTVVQLRGGVPRDDTWARRPDQPIVAISTVDQVGSRLLFRGYGVSRSMWPVHAGLLGQDTLFLLDEVHLAVPFRDTLRALAKRRTPRGGLPDRWRVVEMSATPDPEDRLATFSLDAADRADMTLARRLRASKPVEAVEVKVSGKEVTRRATFSAACADRARQFLGPGRAIAVIVNRVATARDVYVNLLSLRPDVDVRLVTGRMRPLDRADMETVFARVRSGKRSRSADQRCVLIVATQCIEAGADFDFDAIITECASLDALRQRFGRVNRLGEVEEACGGVVLVRSDAIKKDTDDPVYGPALAATWRWVSAAIRDFGIDAMTATPLDPAALRATLPPARRAPFLMPAYLDLWVQTMPVPRPDPEISLWLHGVERRHEPEVQLVWRADVTPNLLAAAHEGPNMPRAFEALLQRLELCPPVGLEAVSVPLGTVRSWLSRMPAADMSDVEGGTLDVERDDPSDSKEHRSRLALVWMGNESRIVSSDDLTPEQVGPGTLLVVPSRYGGLLDGTWDPSALDDVADLGDRARSRQTGRWMLRLHPEVHPSWPLPPPPSHPEEDPDADDHANVEVWLRSINDLVPRESWFRSHLDAFLKRKSAPSKGMRRAFDVVRVEAARVGETISEKGYLALIARTYVNEEAADISAEGEVSSHTGVEIPLDDHLQGVARWASLFANRCGVPDEIARDVVLAARCHDAGKVDPRFQRMLRGGNDAGGTAQSPPLAKSAMGASDRRGRERARMLSGYPPGTRHELASVALLDAPHASLLRDATDRDLVLHLVASHHGWCRPFAPAAADPEPVELVFEADGQIITASSNHGLARLDSGVADRFWQLNDRYGWFGLAWLEAILRLADHRCSEEERYASQAKEGT